MDGRGPGGFGGPPGGGGPRPPFMMGPQGGPMDMPGMMPGFAPGGGGQPGGMPFMAPPFGMPQMQGAGGPPPGNPPGMMGPPGPGNNGMQMGGGGHMGGLMGGPPPQQHPQQQQQPHMMQQQQQQQQQQQSPRPPPLQGLPQQSLGMPGIMHPGGPQPGIMMHGGPMMQPFPGPPNPQQLGGGMMPPPRPPPQHPQQQQQQQQQLPGPPPQHHQQQQRDGNNNNNNVNMHANVSAAAMAQAARGGTGYRAPGSQSAAAGAKEVKNDYSQQFVDTGARPQNYLRDSIITDRYEEYPKLKELVRMKDQMVAESATPAYFLKADLRTLPLTVDTFGTKFDVILVDPPWEEYVRRAPGAPAMRDREVWTWQDIQALEIENIADTPSFLFLWCGTAEGLDAGRHCMAKWGFRRVEDIVWIKTNKDRNPRTGYLQPMNQEPYSILVHTKEHCLMGIKGTVRRNTDGHVIHANCDTDVIVSEEPPGGSTEKPVELYEVIERFSLAKRRLELFGEEHNIRNGWVTVGRSLPTSNFRPDVYQQHFRMPDGRVYVENTTGGRVPRVSPIIIPTPPEVEEARPKSPPQGRR